MLTPEQVHPTKGKLLAEAVWPEKTDGGIIVPTEFQPRYSNTAVVRKCNSSYHLDPGTLLLLDDEGTLIERSYYDVFKVVLRDHQHSLEMLCDSDVEPLFRETMAKYDAEPSAYRHYRITLKDVNTDEVVEFSPPDVVDFGYEDLAHPTYRLEYMPTAMLNLWDGDKYKLFYIIDERRILAAVRW